MWHRNCGDRTLEGAEAEGVNLMECVFASVALRVAGAALRVMKHKTATRSVVKSPARKVDMG